MAVAIGLIIGLVVVSLAVGVPLRHIRRRQGDAHDLAESLAYFEALGETPADSGQARSGRGR